MRVKLHGACASSKQRCPHRGRVLARARDAQALDDLVASSIASIETALQQEETNLRVLRAYGRSLRGVPELDPRYA